MNLSQQGFTATLRVRSEFLSKVYGLTSLSLLLNESWTVKVADFGTSRLMSIGTWTADDNVFDAVDPTMTQGVGTLLWTAPEILGQFGLKSTVANYFLTDQGPYGPEVDAYR